MADPGCDNMPDSDEPYVPPIQTPTSCGPRHADAAQDCLQAQLAWHRVMLSLLCPGSSDFTSQRRADIDNNGTGHDWPQLPLSVTCLLYTSPSPRDRGRS
eukprot:2061502-Amphidinium_carterae.3